MSGQMPPTDPANDEMREFVMSYDFGEGSWMVGFMAASPEEAEQRIEAMKRSLKLLGPASDFIPVEIEYRGPDGIIHTKFEE